ncbi:MAG TPA: LCP family protein, partial [Bacillota bacterium]|nr:LCP family protein [Bacillota bacterium]
MYVNIGISNHQWGLLNAAYSYGGPGLAVRTIERNMGIPIKGYVTVNFNSFVKIVNAAGGVGITLTPAEARHLEMAPGYHLMNGSDALRYARIRKIDSDFQRNRRQRTVVNSIMSAMASNGANLYNVANVVLANTRTNLNLSQYLTPSYLSYQRRQLQLPAMSDTYRTFINGKEVWPFKMGNTHKKLISFLTGN